jgi:hypothetical protein
VLVPHAFNYPTILSILHEPAAQVADLRHRIKEKNSAAFELLPLVGFAADSLPLRATSVERSAANRSWSTG